jgi:DNA-binding NarL/FixJ family response regulator
MTRALILKQLPILAVGIRSTLERATDWQIRTATQDPLVIVQLLEHERQDVTILDDTRGTAVDLLDLLGKQRVASLGMILVVTAAARSEERLFHLAMWGVAAYLSADITLDAFADAARRVRASEWMLTSEGFTRPARQHDHQQQSTAPACAKTSSTLLSPRELDVLSCVAKGKSNKEIARVLLVSDQTIKNHLTAIYKKLVVSDRTSAVVTAIRRGLIKLPTSPAPTQALYASVA